jgi:hypothetical protein
LLMTRPRRARADEDTNVIYWHDDTKRRAALHDY